MRTVFISAGKYSGAGHYDDKELAMKRHPDFELTRQMPLGAGACYGYALCAGLGCLKGEDAPGGWSG
ncbi:hypothetical protein AB0M46_10815 [Dactylosporangium sp. NPDC051485]|uniref:hypothetical protein n=1 Tax=Dactylosporangium sp. NPDC051485 TaxID=3154846 RepID=UPI003421DDBE